MVRFRNGREVGPMPAWHWRWDLWPDGKSDWDVIAWRFATQDEIWDQH